MHLTFTSLHLCNFKSFSGQHTFSFDELGAGLHNVRGINRVDPRLGSNGAGKSTLWHALTWCLFGQTLDGLHNPDVRPRNGVERTIVIVHFRTDEEEHKLLRQAHPNKLELDGKLTNQEAIDRLLGINMPVFANTILMGQGQPLFFDMKPKQKMDLLSDVLQLERWEQRGERASARTFFLRQRLSDIDGQIKGKEAQLEDLHQQLVELKPRWRSWGASQAQTLEALEVDIEKRAKIAEKLKNDQAREDLRYDSRATEARALAKRIEFQQAQMDEWHSKAAGLAGQLNIDKGELQRKRNELTILGKTDRCPTCHQPIKGTSLERHKEEIAKQVSVLERKVKNGIDPAVTAKIKRMLVEINKARETLLVFMAEADQARDAADALTKHIAEEQAKLNASIARRKELMGTENPYDQQMKDLKRRKALVGEELIALQNKANSLQRQIMRTQFWVKGFKEVRLHIVKETLEELELAANAMLQEAGLEGWLIHLDVERETKSGTIQRGLSLTIHSPDNNKPCKWEAWSGGEGQRLRLVGALALSEVLLNRAGVQTSLEILDEPTQHLSKEGISDLVDLLADRARRRNGQIFYCDHQSVESAKFQSILTISKTKAGSRVSANK